MIVYIEWKIDLTKPNKVDIISISHEKNPIHKYQISQDKFYLGSIVLDVNFNQDKIYFTRLNIGTFKPENKIHLFVVKSIKPIYDNQNNVLNNQKIISVHMFGTTNVLTKAIKYTYYLNMFAVLPTNQIELEINQFVKEIKKNKIDMKIDKFNNKFTLFLDTVQLNE